MHGRYDQQTRESSWLTKFSLLSSSSSSMLLPFSTYIRRTYNRHRHRQSLRYLKSFFDSFHTFLAGMDSTMAPPPPPSQSQHLQSEGTSNLDPPPFNPKEPAIPISYPLQTLEELENRSYFDSFHFEFNKSSVKLQSGGGGSLPQRPRILVCHDMAGGYTDDKWVQGGNNPDAYAIWHWYLMDVFVYFSHTLVTLPPPCWTNTGHKHGVKVLGTFIMEWDAGKIMANKLLSTKESAHMYAERLAELAFALGFDGWLLNMEVTLDVAQIPNLKEFVNHLSQTMHSSVPGSLVIWYDSVTVDGDLNWQNQLNSLNKPFFDLCDGIFVNYTWEESYPKDSAKVAGDRKLDVYMGVDVFGRNTYGGGQWTTNVALDLIKKDDVSAAIFAPGWVYETKQPPNFETAQNRWWSLVEKSWGISQKYPNTLPFYTNFDQGHGYHFSVAGAQVSNAPWNNISSQSFQPFLEYTENSVDTIHTSIGFDEASYNGGGNITFKGTLVGNAYFTSRLFVGNLVLEDKPLHFIYSVKSENENSLLGLSLEFSSSTNKTKRSVLLASSHGNTLLTMNRFSNHYDSIIMPRSNTKLDQEPGWILQESSIHMSDNVLTAIHAVCYSSKSIDVLKSEYHAVLGHLLVKTSSQNLVFPPSTSWVVEGQNIKWGTSTGSDGSKKLSMKLSWKLKEDNNGNVFSVFPNYNIYVQKIGGGGDLEYVGEAKVEAYYLSEIVVPSATKSLKFVVQVCNLDGASQKLEESPFFELLQVEGRVNVTTSTMRSLNNCDTNTSELGFNYQHVLSIQEKEAFLCISESHKPTFRTWKWCSPISSKGFVGDIPYRNRMEAAQKLVFERLGHLRLIISCFMGLFCMCYLFLLLLNKR